MTRYLGARGDGPPAITQRHWAWGPLIRKCLAEPGEWFFEERVHDPHAKATYLRGRYGVEVTVADLVGRKSNSTGTVWVRWPTIPNQEMSGDGESPEESPSTAGAEAGSTPATVAPSSDEPFPGEEVT